MNIDPIPSASSKIARVGNGRFIYEAKADWAKLPGGGSWTEGSGVAVDSKDRVYVFHRGKEDPVMVFDHDGNFLHSWGQGYFTRVHGIAIGPDDGVYCTDDMGHVVEKYTTEGKLLFRLGTKGEASDTAATNMDYLTIRRLGGPFNFPTNVAFSPSGEIYVTDGYGNARVHKFAPDGRLLFSWGSPGGGPGQFRIPHGIGVGPDGIVYVADRENNRVQLFSPSGRYLSEWRDLARPTQVVIDPAGFAYVSELAFRAGMRVGAFLSTPHATGGRVSIFDPTGSLVARLGGGVDPTAPGDFFAPHDVCVDSHGDLYVAEVFPNQDRTRYQSSELHFLQKFTLKGLGSK